MSEDQPFTHIQETLVLLEKCKGSCVRLVAWAAQQSSPDAPFSQLLHKHFTKLLAQVRDLTTELDIYLGKCRARRLVGQTILPLPSVLVESLAYTRDRVIEAVELSFFHKGEQPNKSVEALDALFAKTYILDSNGRCERHSNSFSETTNLYCNAKARRMAFEIMPLFRKITSNLPLSGGIQPNFIDPWRSEIDGLCSRVLEQFRPRYVHTYPSMRESFYDIDPNAEIFRGSFGLVRKVVDKHTDASFALKSFQQVFSAKEVTNILREVGVLEACCHKNIVQLIDAFRVQDDYESIHLVMHPWAPYSVFLFLHSDDRKRKARCPWFSPDDVQSDLCIFRILYELADAIEYLHNKGIKHKDIKPENLLLYGEGSCKVTPLVTDLGVSKVYIRGGATKYDDSTYQYLAPEQLELKESSLKSDVWQLGCCFAELFALARGGRNGVDELHASFNRDGEDCGCCIGSEHEYFMRALRKVCLPGNDIHQQAFVTISRMLDPSPVTRIDIQTAKAEIRDILDILCLVLK